MKINKIFMYILLTLFSISFVNAISYDNSIDGGFINSNSHTVAYTVNTNNDTILLVGITGSSDGSDLITSITYNGVSMTRQLGPSKYNGDRFMSLWYLVNPSTGTNNIVVSASSSDIIGLVAASYTGVNQTSPFGATSTTNTYSGSSYGESFTTTIDNSWLFGFFRDSSGGRVYTDTSGDIIRVTGTTIGSNIIDSGAAITPTGTETFTGTMDNTVTGGSVLFTELKPVVGGTPLNPNISIDDISLVNNSYHNSNIPIQLNISVTDTNENVNTTYFIDDSLTNTAFFNNPTKTGLDLRYLPAGTGLTRDAYCVYKGYDSAISFFNLFVGFTPLMDFYTGTIWTTGAGDNKYLSITCEIDNQIGTNTLQPNGTIPISGLSEGQHNITFQVENKETQTNSSTYSFVIDTINPSVEVATNQTEFDTFAINLSNVFNVTDLNLDTCTVNITDYENVTNPDNFLASCTDTVTFVHAGVHNFRVIATDLAGNVNDTTQINVTINPLVLVFFNDQFNSTIIKDYTSIIYHPDGRIVNGVIDENGGTILSPVNNGTLDLGNHTITFSRLGYSTINVTVLVNATNAGRNETFNVTRSKIVINIFDRQNNALLTGLTEITLVATFGANGTTTTGNFNITNVNFLAETYQVIAEHEGYDTETVFFNYNNQETLNVNIFMLNSTESSQITARVITQTGQLISEATCSLLEWKPASSAFVSVAQISTNINGEGIFNVELNTKLYKIQCTKAGITVTSIPTSQIFTTDGAIIPIIFDEAGDIFDSKLKDVSYTLVNTTYNTSHDRITFTWNDASNLVTEGCIKVYRKQINTRILESSTCASGSSTNIQTLVTINNTYDLLVVGEVIDSKGLKEELDQIIYKGINSIQNIFNNWSLQYFIPLISVLGAIAFGLSLKPQTIYISEFVILIVIWGNYIMFPSVMLLGTTIFITFIDTLIIWGSYRVRK